MEKKGFPLIIMTIFFVLAGPVCSEEPLSIGGEEGDVMANLILPGDCNGDGQTTIDELQKSINQLLGVSPVEPCSDVNLDGQVTIDEVQQMINAFTGLIPGDPYRFEPVTLSPSGGTYYLPNGIVLEVPEGAVSEVTTVRLRRVRKEEVMPILQSYGLTEKYFMAAYDGEPKGFKFSKPISIFLPSEPLENSTVLPFLFDVNFVNQIYSPAMLGPQPATGALKNSADVPTNEVIETKYLIFDCKNNQVKIRDLREFPGDEWVQVSAMQDKIIAESDCIENPCRCCTIKVESQESDNEVLNRCVNMKIAGSVTFEDCPGKPVESWKFEETNLGKLVIKKNPEKDTIWCHEEIVLSVDVKDARGNSIPDYEVAVTTENGDIVEITKISKYVHYIKGIRPGKATIKVDPGCDRAESFTVTVNDVDSIEIVPAEKTIMVDEILPLNVTVKDKLGNVLYGYPINWTVQQTGSIVSFDPVTRIVRGLAEGTAIITAATNESCDGVKSGTSTIHVVPPVDVVEITPSPASVWVGGTLQLTATPKDKDGDVLTGLPVSWASSNTAIATVDQTGLVTGVSPGTTTVTATVGGMIGTVIITVTRTAWVEVTPSPASVSVGGTLQLTATPKDKDGNVLTGLPVTWSSDNTAVATVVNGLVAAMGVGTATITATVEGVSGTAIVTVSDNAVQLTFSLSTIPDCHTGPNGVIPTLFVNVGDTMQLTITAKTEAGNVTQAGFYYEWTNTGHPLEPLAFPISPCGLITFTGAYSYSPQTPWAYCAYIHRSGDSSDTVPLATCVAYFVFIRESVAGPVPGYCPWPDSPAHFGCVPGWAYCHDYSYWWRDTPCSM